MGLNSIYPQTYPDQINPDLASWKSIMTGDGYYVGLRSDDILLTWGRNDWGQLGLGDQINRSSPTQLGTQSWTTVKTQTSTAYAIRSDGLLFGWGYSEYGQLANDRIVFPDSGRSFVTVDAGRNHSLGITAEGKLFAWGYNINGQLGDNTNINRSAMVQVGNDSWTQIAGGDVWSLGIKQDGTIWTWGNTYGGTGLVTSKSSPVQILTLPMNKTYSKIARGSYHSMVLATDGTVYTLYGNNYGQLGIGNTNDNWMPSIFTTLQSQAEIEAYATAQGVSAYPISWQSIATKGANFFAAIDSQGKLYTWGMNNSGQLGVNYGTGSTVQGRNFPVQIGDSSWTMVTTSDGAGQAMYAIRTDGALFRWGLNTSYQLGDGTSITKSSPIQLGTSSWIAVAAGELSASAIRSDGALFGWGNNAWGELGLNDTLVKTSPIQVDANSWTSITSGLSFRLAIKADGTAWGWGMNNSGQLGINNVIGRSSPIQVGTSSWVQLAAGNFESAGIGLDGKLYSWGNNQYGQLGDNSTIAKSSPTQIGTNNWNDVEVGTSFKVAIRSDGSLFSWGFNQAGQLGLGSTTPFSLSSPTQIGTSSWSQVSAGASFTVARLNTPTAPNQLWSWGQGVFNQLGNKRSSDRYSPVLISMLNESYISIGAGSYHSMAVRVDGKLFVTGRNDWGQLGTTDIIMRSQPVQIGTQSWIQVQGANIHTLAIASDKTLYVWGDNNTGTLGIGSSLQGNSRSSPVQISAYFDTPEDQINWASIAGVQLNSWQQITSGSNVIYGLTTDGSIWGWGANGNGELGSGTIVDNFYPLPVKIGNSSWTQISAGQNHVMAIRQDGGLFVWGANTNGKLGLSNTLNRSSPVQIGTDSWTSISSGWEHSTAIRTDGAIFAWGLNTTGEMGINTAISRSSPIQVGTDSWTQVSAGLTYTLALRNDGRLFGWGLNTTGQLGQLGSGPSPNLNKSSPVQIGTSSWLMVAASISQGSNAIRSDGALFGWGLGTSGQLADSTAISKSSPIQIGTSSWTFVTNGGTNAVIAKRSDGAIFAWGANGNGQLVDGTTIAKSSPVQVLSGKSWIFLAAARSTGTAYAIDSNYQLNAWGNNPGNTRFSNYGQIVSNFSSPTVTGAQIATWKSISGGENTSAAVREDGRLFTWGYTSWGAVGIPVATGLGITYPAAIGRRSYSLVSSGVDGSHMAALASDGSVWSWGRNDLGNVGVQYSEDLVPGANPYNFNRSSPVQTGLGYYTMSPTQIGLGSWQQLAAGARHVIGIRSDGNVFTWGDNSYGQLADNTNVHKSSPIQISASYTNISAGNYHTTAINSVGELYTWGSLYNPTQFESPTTILIPNVTLSWSKLSSSISHNMAIRSDGKLFVWGSNDSGRLGFNNTNNYFTPAVLDSNSWTQVSAGTSMSAAIRSDGALFLWGYNIYGQLGTFDRITRSSPVQIGTSSWSQVSTNMSHTIAIRSDGALFSWGQNNSGQLGIFNTLSRSSPVQIGTSSWTLLAAGQTHSVAIRSDGALFTFGYNASGNLGDNTVVSKSSPVQIGASSWTQIAAMGDNTIALRINGSLFAWGNTVAVGDLTGLAKSSPVQIGTSSWTQVAAICVGQSGASLDPSNSTTFTALRSDGTVWSWGYNQQGQIGDNSTINKSSPVQLGTSSWTLISGRLTYSNNGYL